VRLGAGFWAGLDIEALWALQPRVMGGEIGVGSTRAVTAPVCFRVRAGLAAACGTAWLATLWTDRWCYTSCPACLAQAPESERLAREATLRAL